MSSLSLDLRSTTHFLVRRKATALVAVLTVGLALGANTAVFTVLDAFLFANLGVPRGERLHQIASTREIPGRGTVEYYNAWPAGELLRETARTFTEIGAVQFGDFAWQPGDGSEPRRLLGARASTGAFAAWQIEPALGRVFRADEEGDPAARVAVISHRLWQNSFAGAGDVLGKTLELDGLPHTLVGVLPRGFSLPPDTDVWLPQQVSADLRARGFGAKLFALYGRLADGVSPAEAQVELRSLGERAGEIDATNKEWTFRSRSVRETLLEGSDRAILLVQAASMLLLALAISNLVSIQLAWAAERQTETAVRLALGAPVRRLVQQFLTHSLLLCAAGGLLGVALAYLALPLWVKLNPSAELDFLLRDLALEPRTLGFTAALVLGATLIAGLLPAWQTLGAGDGEALKGESRGSSASRANLRGQKAMAVLQAGVAVLALSSAALVGVSFFKLDRVSFGFAAEKRAVFRLQLPAATYPTGVERAGFALRLLEELRGRPEIAHAGLTTTLPVDDVRQVTGFAIEEASGAFTEAAVPLQVRGVAPGYLAAMAIPLRSGRDLDERDLAAEAPKVAMVSQALVDKYWPGADPIGRRLRRTTSTAVDLFEIVGVVASVQDTGAAAPPGQAVYLPLQHAQPRRVSVVVHGSASAAGALAAGVAAVRAVAPTLPVFGTARLDELVARANALSRFLAVLLGVFAAVALGITMLGAYGITDQLMTTRSRELAIRMALGAEADRLLRATLWRNARLSLVGAALGLAGAVLVGPLWGSTLFGVDGQRFWLYAAATAGTLLLIQLSTLPAAHRGLRLEVARQLAAK